ncbi:MAG: glycerophosphodiester phosphodiesterase [Gemmatimonadota bacterium]
MPRLPRPRPGFPYFAGSPLLIAHRGGARLGPENTMAAFRQAVGEWGADMLEMDVRATSDGRIVVIHDDTVDRTCDGAGRVEDLSWDALRELDAGHHFRDLSGECSFRGRGVNVPLLDEVLETFPHVRINVEAKAPSAAPGLVRVIRRHAAEHRVLMAATEEEARGSRHGYPGPTSASRRQIRTFLVLHRLPLAALYTPRTDALQVPEVWQGTRVVSPRFVRAAHARNIPVHVWTVDDRESMHRLLDWGVDGIQTDRPDVLSAVLSEVTGRPSPPAAAAGPRAPRARMPGPGAGSPPPDGRAAPGRSE